MKEGQDFFIIRRGDNLYPPLLEQIADPPAQLYVRGDPKLLHTRAFAVVGSRDVTDYGRRAIETIVTPLARYFTIVSGMALGADASAHCAALANPGGKTIAVLGCGVDDASIYPRSHISLAHKILASGGCLVSEYPIGELARPFYFPARNRIVAGLSLGVLIAEAARDSGTMITARLALDYGRDVFAVPGSIFSKLSEGTNELIQKGACATVCTEDILQSYEIEAVAKQAKLLLSDAEQKIHSIIATSPCSVTEVIQRSAFSASETMTIISELEVRGIIVRTGNSLTAKK
ncbi:MAG: DNA-processing protein DprA [Candidatus Magasanikbacteria bacterium]|nr:DNA-processing protein DprA [Candidatus Magasanikbacteria bacterium]